MEVEEFINWKLRYMKARIKLVTMLNIKTTEEQEQEESTKFPRLTLRQKQFAVNPSVPEYYAGKVGSLNIIIRCNSVYIIVVAIFIRFGWLYKAKY